MSSERRIGVVDLSEESRSSLPPEGRPPRYYVPPWVRSPQGVFPGVVALELVLARREKVAVGIPRVYGYPEWFELELRVIGGSDGEELGSRLYRAGRAGRLQPDANGLLPAEMLRVAIQRGP